MYAITEFHLVSLFSFRMLTTNAFAARTLPCPTPAGIKLALLAQMLEAEGAVRAPEHLDWLAPLRVLWRPPARLTVSTATVRIYKADTAGEPLIGSVGMREYAHMAEPFALAIGSVPDERRDSLTLALAHLRALGTAESLVQPLAPAHWAAAPPDGFVELTSDPASGTAPAPARGHAVVIDDLGPAPSWERLNVYRVPDRRRIPQLGADRVRRIVTLPLRVERWTETGYTLAELPPAEADDDRPGA
ncbi:MAG: hypothetical protein IT340_17230 [Chloroflexi bacterium]|nr:hypothetical protein [Chloroflexota bacterium]